MLPSPHAGVHFPLFPFFRQKYLSHSTTKLRDHTVEEDLLPDSLSLLDVAPNKYSLPLPLCRGLLDLGR